MSLRQKVLDEINAERDRQEAKWGRQDHQPERWLSILGEEFGEVCKAVCEASFPGYETTGDWSQYRKELIHVAAVAAAMAECFDRREETSGEQVLRHQREQCEKIKATLDAKRRKLHVDYLSKVNWDNKSLSVLDAVREAYIDSHDGKNL